MEIKKDISRDIFDKIDEIEAKLHGCVAKAERAAKKNAQLHIMIESGIMDKMKERAEKAGISLSEWCRKKLKDDSQLDRIEEKLERLLK